MKTRVRVPGRLRYDLSAKNLTTKPPILSVPMPVGPSLSVWTKPNRGWKHHRLIAKLRAKYGDVRPTLSDREITDQLAEDSEVRRWGPDAAPSERAINRAGNEVWGPR
jgi:hypothetical protein